MKRFWIGLAVFTLYLLWVNHDYYRADTQTPTYDEAWYLETSLHLYHRLTTQGVAGFWDGYRRAFGIKAPLLSVLPLPFYVLLGPSREAAMLVNSFFLVLANVYLFLLVRQLYSPSAALAAVVFFQTMPLAYGLSRNFMVEYGLSSLVIVFLYYLVARPGQPVLLGILLGLGLLMKILFPAYVAGPLALTLYRRRSWRDVLLIALPAAVIASTWYAFNLRPLLAFAWESAYGGIAPDYSAGGLSAWLALLVNQGTSVYYAAVVLILAPLALRGHLALLAAWLLPPLAALALGRNQLIRFALPLLPVFAIGLGAAVFSLGRRWRLQAALAVALAVFPYRLFAALSYRSHSAHSVRLGPLVLYAHELGWARPPVHEDPWEHRRLLEAVHRLAPDAVRPFYVVLTLDHTYLNANLLNYLNAYENYPIRFTSLGYGESSLDRALERIFRLDARFLLLGEGFRGLPGFLNRLHDDLRGRLERGELPFRLRAEVPLAPPAKALLYERDAPWTTVADPRPTRPQSADFPGGVRLLGYDWKSRGPHLGELTCYWTASQPLRQRYLVRLEFPSYTHEYFLPDWTSGQALRETRYLSSDSAAEVRLSLIPWGIGPGFGPVVLRLAE